MARNSSNQNGCTRRTRRLLLRKKLSSKLADAEGKESGRLSTYEPEWSSALEGYTVRILRRNLWRYERIMSFDDAYQEAFVKFLELQEKYRGQANSARHFMALYKTSLANLVTDFSKQSRRFRRQVCFTELGQVVGQDGESVSYDELLQGDADTDALFEMSLDDAPEHVRQVLMLIINSRPDMLMAISDSWFEQGKRKEGGNQFLCRLLGYNHREVDLVWAVVDYFEGN